MKISIGEPVNPSLARVKKILFERLDFNQWLVLGFCVFLGGLGEGGGGGCQFNLPWSPASMPITSPEEAKGWVMAHLAILIVAGALIFTLIMALGLVVQWLSSRGRFILLDNVVKNQIEVVKPWEQFRTLANSLFIWRVILGMVAIFLFGLILAISVLIAWPDIQAVRFGVPAILALLAGVVMLLVLVVVALVVGVILDDFVVPIMYRRNLKTGAAWRVFQDEILRDHFGAFALFCLMRLALSMGANMIVATGSCVTCCIAGLPYVSSVAFLPLWLFLRCYSLYFLEQFGGPWRFFDKIN